MRQLNTPETTTAKGLRDRAILAVLLGCGLWRSEVAALTAHRSASKTGGETSHRFPSHSFKSRFYASVTAARPRQHEIRHLREICRRGTPDRNHDRSRCPNRSLNRGNNRDKSRDWIAANWNITCASTLKKSAADDGAFPQDS
jgi:hypothetical protein